MPFDPQTPYNEMPLLPPPGELETRAVLKKGHQRQHGQSRGEWTHCLDMGKKYEILPISYGYGYAVDIFPKGSRQ